MPSFERTTHSPTIVHTVLACVGLIVIYAVLVFVIPILMGLYDLLTGSWAAAGNPLVAKGREDPSVLSVLLKLAITSGGAAFGSFFLTARLFSRAHGRTVTTVFSLAFLGLLAFYALGAFFEPAYRPAVEVLIWLVTAIPTFYFIRKAWKHEFFDL